MARQIDPWLGVPQGAVLEENLLTVQLRLQALEARVRDMEARLGRVAQGATETRADTDRAGRQALALEARLAGVAAALLMLADELAAGGQPAQDAPAAVARQVTSLLEEVPCG